MNLFKGLLFLEGHVSQPHLFDDAEYGSSYGNRAASERLFGRGVVNFESAQQRAALDTCSAAGCG